MENKKEFKILSIDGGGIKGIYPARVLEEIEKKFGKKIIDHFDLICGTSTGGLIALGLSLGRSPKEIADFYSDRGMYIFPKITRLQRIFSTIKQGFIANKYNAERLRKEVISFIGEDKKIKDCKSLLCIPAYNISHGRPIVFKYPHKEGNFNRDGELNVIDVAMATSAAPTYFKNHQINHKNLDGVICADGGVWCNNPSLAGLLEAWRFFVGTNKEYKKVTLLSISTIPEPKGSTMKGGSFWRWRDKLINTSLDGQSFFTDFFLKTLSNDNDFEVSYQRVIPTNLSASQYKKIEMDLASEKAIQLLNQIGRNSGIEFSTQEYNWLSKVFEEKKHYII